MTDCAWKDAVCLILRLTQAQQMVLAVLEFVRHATGKETIEAPKVNQVNWHVSLK